MTAPSSDTGSPSRPSDDELTALALAADPDTTLDDDAVCLWDLNGLRSGHALSEWYMPAPMGGPRPLQGWRRRVVVPIIASFLAITAFGLCNTYGQLGFG